VIKFGRNYLLSIETASGKTIKIGPPFTVEFDITRNTLTSANVAQFRVYNLSPENRNQIRFNVFDTGIFRGLKFEAGYGSDLGIAFSGGINIAWSVREGVNFISQIECFDGGFAFANGTTNQQFPAGVAQKSVIAAISKDLPHTSTGAIGSYPGVLSKGNAYSGNTGKILDELTGGGAFIDNGIFNALNSNEYIAETNDITVINTESGLLGTPIREPSVVRFDMLFEPRLSVGQKINLQSETEEAYNGVYKVTGVKHRGVISGAVCGSAITTGEFLFDRVLVGVPPVP